MASRSAGHQVCTITHISLTPFPFSPFVSDFCISPLYRFLSPLLFNFSVNSSPPSLTLSVSLLGLSAWQTKVRHYSLYPPWIFPILHSISQDGKKDGACRRGGMERRERGMEKLRRGRDDETFQCKPKTFIYREMGAFYTIYAEFTGTCWRAGSNSLARRHTTFYFQRACFPSYTNWQTYASTSPWGAGKTGWLC